MIVASGLAPKDVKTPEACFIILATGAELGLSAMQSLRLIHTFNGVVCPAASLMVALVKRSPVCRYFHMVTGDERESTWETWRMGEPEAERLTYTVEDAARQGLTNKDNWKKSPKAMLRARASSALARTVYPDVVWGLHSKEEIEGGEIAQDTPALVIDPPDSGAPAGERVVEKIRAKRGRPRKVEASPVVELEPEGSAQAEAPSEGEGTGDGGLHNVEIARRHRWHDQIMALIKKKNIDPDEIVSHMNKDLPEAIYTMDDITAANVPADILEDTFNALVL